MADILKFIPFIRQVEGGLSRNTYDAAAKNPCLTPYFGEYGWHTNSGVTWLLWSSVIGTDPVATERWFKMSDTDLAFIINKYYWQPCLSDQINDQPIANAIVDFAFNSGVGTAIKHVQQLIGATPDGIAGNQTIALINASDSDTLYQNIINDRLAYFKEIVANNPSQSVFLEGWENRINSLKQFNSTIA